MIQYQTELGNEIHFPSEDLRVVAVFSKADPENKCYRIFDN